MRFQLDLMMLASHIFGSGGPAPKFLADFPATTGVERRVVELCMHVQLTIRWHEFRVAIPGVEVVAADSHDGDMCIRVRVEDKAKHLEQLQFVCEHIGFRDITFKADSPMRTSNAGLLVFTVPSSKVYVLRTTR